MFLVARRKRIGAADRVLAADLAVAPLDCQVAAARIEQMLFGGGGCRSLSVVDKPALGAIALVDPFMIARPAEQ